MRVICGTIAGDMAKVAAILGVCLATVLTCGGIVHGQSSRNHPVARKFDEFGKGSHCDLTARLDNFAIELQNNPTWRGAVIAYGPDVEGLPIRYLDLVKEYFVNARGIVEDRLTMIYGGRNDELTQLKFQLWIVPKGAAEPKPQKFETNVETMRGLLGEWQSNDDFGAVYEADGEAGIPEVPDAAFADILNHQKNAIGYVVVQAGKDLTPGAWRKLAQQEIDDLKPYKIDENRIKMVLGGHQTETKIQFWIGPKDEPPPVADAGPEAPLDKAVKVGDFYNYGLNESNQNAIFARLEELLRNDKNLRAFLVVRLDPAANQEVYDDEQPQPVDLSKIAEKWRLELAKTHKIGPDRFIVLFSPSDSDYLSLWIVPNGVPLPDPTEPEIVDDAGVKP